MRNDRPMDEWIELARELAHESGKLISGYFGTRLEVKRKADDSPVTIADQESEALMRRIIESRYPDHAVVGEEHGTSGNPDAPYQWLLDPIDGTKSFIHGVPLFCTLIALLENGRPILGVIHLPALGDLMIGAKGRKTTLNGEPVRVSGTTELSQATVAFTCTKELWAHGHGEAFQSLQERAGLVRGWGDGYGYLLVASGRADVMIDPVLNAWDVAALKPCIEGAGGRITEISGAEKDLGESAVCTNGHLHSEVLDIMNGRNSP